MSNDINEGRERSNAYWVVFGALVVVGVALAIHFGFNSMKSGNSLEQGQEGNPQSAPESTAANVEESDSSGADQAAPPAGDTSADSTTGDVAPDADPAPPSED